MAIDIRKQEAQRMRAEFEELLRSTGREGVDYVIEDLADLGFFIAPASTRFHLNYEGGLLEHSLNVCKVALMLREQMIAMRPDVEPFFPKDSVIVASLLHDVCKADIYKPTIKKKKNAFGVWVDEPGYDVDYSKFPLGHGEKSVVVILRCGFDLTDDEILAIRWHMTAWDLPFQSPELKNCLNTARDRCPLCGLIQSADGLAANILERTDKEEEE
ncbi:MAG: HD domain-containing protein [Bacteroidales bacterium]|nr:HD domain-containing protein [Bacteroidales bacterium]